MASKPGLFHRAMCYIRLTPIRRTRRKVRKLKADQKSNLFFEGASKSVLRGDRRRSVVRERFSRELRERESSEMNRYVSGLIDASPKRRLESISYVAQNLLMTTQPVVVQLLKDENAIVRGNAIITLTMFEALALSSKGNSAYKEMNFIDSISAIRKRLNDNSPLVRRYALISLGMIEDQKCINQVRKMLNDDNKVVQRFSQMVLAANGEKLPAGSEYEMEQALARYQLKESYKEIVEKITGIKYDKNMP